MTLTIIYLSGVLFFLSQAYIYASVGKQRIIGALTWPILIVLIPHCVMYYRDVLKKKEAKLRFDGRLGIKSFRIGGDGKDYRWGIGA